jgi:lysophospholipase L1-like esterase
MKPFDPLMARVLDEAQRRVEGWGGRLVLLYLPERRERPGRGAARRQTLRLVEQLGIPLIDVSETLASHPDPESLYPLRLRFSAHFDGDGYRLVADALAARLPAARGGPSP